MACHYLAALWQSYSFSFPSANIIHYLVNKNDIIQLSTEYNTKHADNGGGVTARKSATNATALMNFALTPFTGIKSDIDIIRYSYKYW